MEVPEMAKRGLNRGILDSVEDTMHVLGLKEGIRNGSEGARGVQSALQR